MGKAGALFASFLILGVGCVGTGKVDPEAELEAIAQADEPAGVEVKTRVSPRTVAAPSKRLINRSLNLTIHVKDPSAALEKARNLIVDAGGEINNASAQHESANLNATVHVSKLDATRKALLGVGGKVQSENMSTGDMTQNITQLRHRLALLHEADDQIATMLKAASEPHTTDALMLQRELNVQERRNVENQLQSQHTQALKGQIYINFARPAPPQPPVPHRILH